MVKDDLYKMDFRRPLWDPQGAERAAGPDLGGGDGGQDCFPDGGGVCGGQEQKLDKVKITLVLVLFQNLSQNLSVLCLTDDLFFRMQDALAGIEEVK